jgi:hypothetical protein
MFLVLNLTVDSGKRLASMPNRTMRRIASRSNLLISKPGAGAFSHREMS